jgi:hypothetical protein
MPAGSGSRCVGRRPRSTAAPDALLDAGEDAAEKGNDNQTANNDSNGDGDFEIVIIPVSELLPP